MIKNLTYSFVQQQSTPLFLKKGEGFGERGKNLFSRPLSGLRKNSPFASLGLEQQIKQQSTPLFFERERGCGGKGKLSFHGRSEEHTSELQSR